MLTVYGIQSCGTCREMRAAFDKAGVPYVYKNFSENIQNLKDFLKLRDSLPLFDEVKARGGVGTPCLVSDDGKVTWTGSNSCLQGSQWRSGTPAPGTERAAEARIVSGCKS